MPLELNAVDHFTRWFDSYTNRFFGADECINAHLRMKQEHTRRTRAEILALAGQLMLDERQRWVAEVVALFHVPSRAFLNPCPGAPRRHSLMVRENWPTVIGASFFMLLLFRQPH
jgi:hypothetical protein